MNTIYIGSYIYKGVKRTIHKWR